MSSASLIGAAIIVAGVALLLHWLPDTGEARTSDMAGTALDAEPEAA
jgi:hypothetical protein